ncbi:hypothetical protein [Streptomyces sp. FH025]|uniref:hypothetical protein n=1 Tax=Streptomyces sp. FH025 TaxID=2815937 RepID=UPI001FAF95A6|nr:hypothetical protein [Streptomyces sp. FH025]
MASTHTPAHPAGPAAGTQLLDHPGPEGAGSDGAGPFGPETETSRHRLPRQTRGASPLLGVTAVAATLGATGFASATPASFAAWRPRRRPPPRRPRPSAPPRRPSAPRPPPSPCR